MGGTKRTTEEVIKLGRTMVKIKDFTLAFKNLRGGGVARPKCPLDCTPITVTVVREDVQFIIINNSAHRRRS